MIGSDPATHEQMRTVLTRLAMGEHRYHAGLQMFKILLVSTITRNVGKHKAAPSPLRCERDRNLFFQRKKSLKDRSLRLMRVRVKI